ncbi:MAG: hypothetical protein ACK5V3_11100 [Bdellovibrionales bacterium]
MNQAVLSILIILFSHQLWAQNQRLAECQNSCSSRCVQWAEDLIESGREILSRCGSSGGATDREIISRCNWHFSQDLAIKCASRANSVAVIDRCQWHFGNSQKGLNCVSARSVEIVDRCNWHFGNTESGSACAGRARNKEVVDQCVWNFGANAKGLSCITGE